MECLVYGPQKYINRQKEEGGYFGNQLRSDLFVILFSQINVHMAKSSSSIEIQPISLTADAIEALNKIRQEESIPDDHYLRVGVKGGGCSGFTYVLGFDVKKENDEVFEVGGLPVVMQRAHQLYLMGIEIDWSNGLNNRGFVFNNPNATDTCGCGTSFNA